MKKVLFSAFIDLAQDSLLTYSKNVVSMMTTNTAYSKFSSEVEALKAINSIYAQALEDNLSGGKPATAEKDKAKMVVTNQLKTIGTLVSILAAGDETVILSAGFDVTRDRISYTSLDTPFVLELTNLPETSLAIIRLAKIAGATNYLVKKRIKTNDPNAPWDASQNHSALKIQVRVVQPKHEYQFIFRAIGNKGLYSEWSQVYELFIS